ncbi:MAG TPA: RNA helicase [Cyanobacteria bacterium UBA9971]|nr:RNA helicase [Cyanobacteria bacterium UBA9971]
MSKLRFEELNLSQEVLNAVKDMGFEEASPIQAEAIPLIMDGKDIIGQAQTGTGKTAAFAIPIIEKIDASSKELQAVILCPTRELVIQVSEEFRKLMKYRENLFVAPIYGGQPIERQLGTLRKGVQVVIGTPGRTMDHMRRGSIKMNAVKIIVLDEADEMLDMGFRDDMEVILKDTPETRQTVMFSATMAPDIIGLTKLYQKDSVIVNVTNKKLSAPKIQQIYFEVQDKNKPEVLSRLLDIHNIKLALVFCNTKSQVDSLVEILKTRGYFADALHGDMSQNYRDRVMNGFRNGTVEILVATDVAGRGIDVNDVEAVFNYDLPRDDEDYTHRIGRTARAGKTGTAFTFVTGKQIYNLKRIERANGVLIKRQSVPTIDEIETTRINTYAEKIGKIVETGHLSKFVNHIEQIMGDELTSIDVAAALLKITMDKENESFDRTVNFEEPVREQRPQGRFPDKRFGNRYTMKDNFRRNNGENKPFMSSERNRNDAPKEARPSREGYGRSNNDRKPEGEFKPYRSSERNKDDAPREARPSREGFGRPNNDRKPEGEFKPYRSDKKRDDSFKKARLFGERTEKPEVDRGKEEEYKPFKSAGKKKSDSPNKDGKFFDKKFSKPKSGDKKPGKKFNKDK